MGVENGYVNGGHFYMNSPNRSESNNHNSIDSTNERYEIATNIAEMENNGLQGGVVIYVMLPVPTLIKYENMKYNSEHHNLLINGKMFTSNNSSVSTLTSLSVTSTSYEGC